MKTAGLTDLTHFNVSLYTRIRARDMESYDRTRPIRQSRQKKALTS